MVRFLFLLLLLPFTVLADILPALLVGSGLKPPSAAVDMGAIIYSPGFIGREWIETGR